MREVVCWAKIQQAQTALRAHNRQEVVPEKIFKPLWVGVDLAAQEKKDRTYFYSFAKGLLLLDDSDF